MAGKRLSDKQIAEGMRVSKRTLAAWRDRGFVGCTLEEAKRWHENNVLPRKGGPKTRASDPGSDGDNASPRQRLTELLDCIDDWQARIAAGGVAQARHAMADLNELLRDATFCFWLRLPANRRWLTREDLEPAIKAFEGECRSAAAAVGTPRPTSKRAAAVQIAEETLFA